MAITLSDAFSDNLLGHASGATAGVADQIGGGTLELRASGGSPPAGPNEAANGTLLASWTFSAATSQGTPAAGVMTIVFSSNSATAGNTGTADYFRVKSSGAVALIQGLVGISGSDWNLTSVAITTGDQVTITGTPTIQWVDS